MLRPRVQRGVLVRVPSPGRRVPRRGEDAAGPLFAKAIAHYRTVADQFKTLTKLYPCQPGKNKPMRERFEDPALRAKAVAALTAARTAEDKGLKALAKIHEFLTTSRQ